MTVSSRSSPPRGCDVICGGTSPLRSSLPSGTRSPGSGGRACEETPRQPGGRREQNGSSASDAGFLQEPVRACFRPSCHPRHRHAHQQSHTERWDYRAQACSSKREGFEGINMSAPPLSVHRGALQLLLLPPGRLLQRVHLRPRKIVSGCCPAFLLGMVIRKRIRAVGGFGKLLTRVFG